MVAWASYLAIMRLDEGHKTCEGEVVSLQAPMERIKRMVDCCLKFEVHSFGRKEDHRMQSLSYLPSSLLLLLSHLAEEVALQVKPWIQMN